MLFGGGDREGGVLTVAEFVAEVKGPDGEEGEGCGSVERGEVDGNEEGGEDHHGALEEVNERPLRLVVGIRGTDCPGSTEAIDKVFNGHSPGYARGGGICIQPERIGIPCKFIRAKLADRAADYRRRCRWQSEPERASKGADGKVRKRGFDITGSSELDGFERVDETGEDEEDGDPGVALGHEPKDGSLEEEDGFFIGAAARED